MKTIPLVKIQSQVDFCKIHKQEASDLLKTSRKTFGLFSDLASRLLLPSADRLARKWLINSHNPYLDEIKKCSQILGVPGVYALNLSYEWGCSTGVFQNKQSTDMLRVLDWPFPGLGKGLFVLHQSAHAGEFYNVSWPCVSGVFQAMAPGRFSAAINQAPMRRHNLSLPGDWLVNRKIMFKQFALPPAHLLRQVFETATNYEQAKSMLIETHICMPVMYILSGVKPGQACIIERLENKGMVRELSDNPQVSVTNHFQTNLASIGKGWRSRAVDSQARAEQIADIVPTERSLESFTDIAYPVINPLTRLCMLANAKNSMLIVQGWERDGPKTQVFSLQHSHYSQM